MSALIACINSIRVTTVKGWRIHVLAADTSPDYVAMIELEFRATIGGTSLCTGGTGFASSNLSGGSVANLYDGVSTGDAFWASTGPSDLHPYVGYLLPTPSAVNQISIVARSGAPGQAPKDFDIESSPNTTTGLDGTWTTEWSVTGSSGWTSNQQRSFNRP